MLGLISVSHTHIYLWLPLCFFFFFLTCRLALAVLQWLSLICLSTGSRTQRCCLYIVDIDLTQLVFPVDRHPIITHTPMLLEYLKYTWCSTFSCDKLKMNLCFQLPLQWISHPTTKYQFHCDAWQLLMVILVWFCGILAVCSNRILQQVKNCFICCCLRARTTIASCSPRIYSLYCHYTR